MSHHNEMARQTRRSTRVVGEAELPPVPVKIYDLFMALHIGWVEAKRPDGTTFTLGAGAGMGSPHLFLQESGHPSLVIDVRDMVPLLLRVRDEWEAKHPDFESMPALPGTERKSRVGAGHVLAEGHDPEACEECAP